MATSLIDQTVTARTPSGRKVQVNRFDYNLKIAAIQGEEMGITLSPGRDGPRRVNRYIQCDDGSWIRADALTVG